MKTVGYNKLADNMKTSIVVEADLLKPLMCLSPCHKSSHQQVVLPPAPSTPPAGRSAVWQTAAGDQSRARSPSPSTLRAKSAPPKPRHWEDRRKVTHDIGNQSRVLLLSGGRAMTTEVPPPGTVVERVPNVEQSPLDQANSWPEVDSSEWAWDHPGNVNRIPVGDSEKSWYNPSNVGNCVTSALHTQSVRGKNIARAVPVHRT